MKVSIKCTAEQKERFVDMFLEIKTCQFCPLLRKCDKYNSCDDVVENEISWDIVDMKQ